MGLFQVPGYASARYPNFLDNEHLHLQVWFSLNTEMLSGSKLPATSQEIPHQCAAPVEASCTTDRQSENGACPGYDAVVECCPLV